ncbi:tyrosine-type recombinase/integrase [Alkalinema pantanalense CENA528]|uniref:tyrosine-type recombinase/integrase n=1 Tax=Alkalinema pantanalense TaxID=1620705 RepID=UPI003D6E9AFB
MPKVDRNGQASIWENEAQFLAVLAEMPPAPAAVMMVCYYTCCRVGEAVQLRREDIVNGAIVFRKDTTKTKQSRSVPLNRKLLPVLEQLPTQGYLFPGRKGHLTTRAVDKALRIACDRLGLAGFSTHSNRRTAATRLSQSQPLKVVQEIGGWSQLGALQRYLEVSEEQKRGAIDLL